METGALCEANLKRSVSVVVNPEKMVLAMDHSWSDEEITHLSRLLWSKKIGELEELNTGSEPNLDEGSEPKLKKGRKTDIKEEGSGMDADDKKVFTFRRRWIAQWSNQWGSFEDVTMELSMPFTFQRAPKCAYPCDTLQIFSVQVAELFGGLKLPLDVFGMVAVRDCIDRNRNLVFYRSRDNCQTLTEKDPYLALTGPTRAVALCPETIRDQETDVVVEFDLKVRGKVESEDRYLSLLAAPVPTMQWFEVINWRLYNSKCSSLKFTFASVRKSVEATIFIRVIEGSWPDGVHGQLTALFPFVGHEKLVLLEFGADDVPVSGNGYVELSRQVVSVALYNELVVSCNAWKDGILIEQGALFKPALAGGSRATLQLGTCKLEIIVAWSVVSPCA